MVLYNFCLCVFSLSATKQFIGINNSTECQKIPCPKAKGWTGDYMPYCDFTPVCPDNFPGVYPFCNKYGRKDVKQATNLI